MSRIEEKHITCFLGMEKPLFLISEQYPGLWLEHVYDSVLLARLEPKYLGIAENAVNLFIDRQRENGHLPFSVMDRSKRRDLPEGKEARYSQIQECVSFYTLALEVYEMNRDRAFLEKIYESGRMWDSWLRRSRMTTGRGLVEMFVGFDTGHDNSARLRGIGCKGNYAPDGIPADADVMPPDDGITPVLAVDMSCNLYGNEISLSKMADILGRPDEAEAWRTSAALIKQKLFDYCYDGDDGFFYDVDRAGNKRKYRSCAVLHLFLEGVLDKELDRRIIDRIYSDYLKNPEEFWTEYPFPSMSVSDPSVIGHPSFNCWGYYTQGLTVLRCIRWMDEYGYGDDLDYILGKWVEAWSEHYEAIPFAQEIDPITGVPTRSSEWYSSCMLAYIYAVRRLRLVE